MMPDPTARSTIVFLTVRELAAALQVPVSWVYAQTCRPGLDSIPRVRLGKGYRFDLADVVRWLKDCRDPRLSLSPGRRPRLLAMGRRRAPNIRSGTFRDGVATFKECKRQNFLRVGETLVCPGSAVAAGKAADPSLTGGPCDA